MADTSTDDQVLREMLVLAEKLSTDDELMRGQYAFLRSRIDALLELRGAGAEA